MCLEYLGNSMKKLRRLAMKQCGRYLQNGNLNEQDFMSTANMVFWETVRKYDENKGNTYQQYLASCLHRRFIDVFDNIQKKSNVRVSTKTVPIDASENEDGIGLDEILHDDRLTEDCINPFDLSDGVFNYVSSFCGIYRDIIELILRGYTEDQIMEILHLTRRQYGDCMAKLRSSKHTLLIRNA